MRQKLVQSFFYSKLKSKKDKQKTKQLADI